MSTTAYTVAGAKAWKRRVFDEVIVNYPGDRCFLRAPDHLTHDQVSELSPCCIFFVHWSWKVPAAIGNNYECVCFHMTAVPFGRGGSPLQSWIVREHRQTKLTTLRMCEDFDAGSVYLKADLCRQGNDDEILRCGGTVARMTQGGEDVSVAILSEGITSRYDLRGEADQDQIEALRERTRQMAQLLGVTELFTHDLPDNRSDTVPLLDIIKTVEEVVERVQPRVIYTHHSGDLNIDQVIVHRAELTATRPQIGQPVKAIYAFEVPSSTEWAFGQFSCFQPNVFVGISATLATELEAMALYESEVRPFPHPRSPKALRALARWRGSAAGLEAAEGFEAIRDVRR